MTTTTEPKDYAAAITKAWKGSTQNILDACSAAMMAKADGVLGDVTSLCAGVVDRSTLARLALIGECRDLYAVDAATLPPAWGTLYELTKVPNLADKIASGEVTPTIQRSVVTGWYRVPKANGAAVAAAVAGQPATLGGAIKTLEGLRKAGAKPADLVGQVKPGQIRLAIAFLQAIEAATKQAAQGGAP